MKLFLHASMGMAAIVTLVWTEQATASTIVQDRRPPAFTLVQGVTPRPSCQCIARQHARRWTREGGA